MTKNWVLYEAFADGFEKLNHTLASERMLNTSHGRAYRVGERTLYAEPVHVCMIGESDAHHQTLQNAFRLAPTQKVGVYAGAAGFLNLGYIAAARPAAAVLFDVNMAQTVFWQEVIEMLAQHDNPAAFKLALLDLQFTLPQQLGRIFDAAKNWPVEQEFLTPQKIYRELKPGKLLTWLSTTNSIITGSDLSWLGPEYEILHTMAKKRALAALTLDVTDRAACKQLQQFLAQKTYMPVIAPWAAPSAMDAKKLKQAPISSGNISLKICFEKVCRMPNVPTPTLHLQQSGLKIDTLYASNIFTFLNGNSDWTKRDLPNATPTQARRNLKLLVTNKPAIIGPRPAWGGPFGWPQPEY